MTGQDEVCGDVSGFVRAEGSKLVNGDGKRILLRGVGLGSWLLPEGYMWKFPEGGDRPRRIELMIEELVGAEKAAEFWRVYYDRHTSEADIERIAAEGFNSVRVPINARFLLEDGDRLAIKEAHLALIDRLIGWCKDYRLYVILDLHGAPGGQTGTNIDDSERDLPELFMEEKYKRLTVELWRFLAERYKDEWIVAGYDLLNEPLPDWFSKYNGLLMPLYKEIVQAIREVDTRHMIILEGAHWATDWSVFTERIDDNLMLQFHKYWSSPDTDSLRSYLDKRAEWDVPIFMGEGGENKNEWYIGAFQLFEDHDISWNFWPWKKMATSNSPCSVAMPTDWKLLTDYLQGGARPGADAAERVLWAFLDSLPLERCAYRPEVVRSMLRRTPIRIPAVYYRHQGDGSGFGTTGRTERRLGFRDRDGTDIRFVESEAESEVANGKGKAWQKRLCVQLEPGDWLSYEVELPDPQKYMIRVQACPAADRAAVLSAAIDGEDIGRIALEGDAGVWQQAELHSLHSLKPGKTIVIVRAEHGPLRIEWIETAQLPPFQ